MKSFLDCHKRRKSVTMLTLWIVCLAIFPILAAAQENSTSNSTEHVLLSDGNQVRKESFKDWAQWKERYAGCDPEKNSYMSPIKIEPDNIVSAPKMKRMLVHSKLPVDDCLYLSALYKENDLEMEAVTINAFPDCSEQLTHISIGRDLPHGMRYFKRAVFFFTNTQPEVERSLHQVKGQQGQMEIMMEFVSVNKTDYTQVFLMVEAKPPETIAANPVFTVLEPALLDLKQEIIDEAAGKSERALKFKELKDACHISGESYLKAHQEVKEIIATDRLKRVKGLIRNINGITNEDLKNLEGKNNSSSTKTSNETSNTTSIEMQKLEKLRGQRSKLLDMIQKEKDQWALDKLESLYGKVEYAINKMETQKVGKSESKLDNIRKLLRSNNVGMPGESSFPGMLYESPDTVHADLVNISSKMDEYIESTNLYNKSCSDFLEFQKEPGAAVRINEPFQISWLFPNTGGYYLYNGSSPIPECQRRETTIVFEKPISISSDQLSLFQNLPSLEKLQKGSSNNNQSQVNYQTDILDGESKVDKMIPILSDGAGRTVWFVAKDPDFLNDDGFHMRSAHARQVGSGATAIGNTLAMKQCSFLYASIIPLGIAAILLVQK